MLQCELLGLQDVLFATVALFGLSLLTHCILQGLALGVELALLLLEQIVARILLLEQHAQIVHLVGHLLCLALPLAHNLTLFHNFFVGIGKLKWRGGTYYTSVVKILRIMLTDLHLQMLLERDQLFQIVLMLRV